MKTVWCTIINTEGKFTLDDLHTSKANAFAYLKKLGIKKFLGGIDPELINKKGESFTELNLLESTVSDDEHLELLRHGGSQELLERIYEAGFGTTANTKTYFVIDAGELWRFMEWYAEEHNMLPSDVEKFIDYESDRWQNALKEYISIYFK